MVKEKLCGAGVSLLPGSTSGRILPEEGDIKEEKGYDQQKVGNTGAINDGFNVVHGSSSQILSATTPNHPAERLPNNPEITERLAGVRWVPFARPAYAAGPGAGGCRWSGLIQKIVNIVNKAVESPVVSIVEGTGGGGVLNVEAALENAMGELETYFKLDDQPVTGLEKRAQADASLFGGAFGAGESHEKNNDGKEHHEDAEEQIGDGKSIVHNSSPYDSIGFHDITYGFIRKAYAADGPIAGLVAESQQGLPGVMDVFNTIGLSKITGLTRRESCWSEAIASPSLRWDSI
ncbi:MAG TPA: hypothetical protein DIS62_01405 [Candidatus Kerfeldbacteria bacterium]|nr:hypothetical protein [Candidatus Kerfeldbacteria bacterium]